MENAEFERGFVYVATGRQYVQEAMVSAQSLKQHNPDIPICLISDCKVDSPLFSTVIEHPNPQFDFIDKLKAVLAPFERVVFLDSDTLILDDLTEIFEVLDRFDIGATLESYRGWDYEFPDLPRSFPEITTGLIAFRRSQRVKDFFEKWEETYKRFLSDFADREERFRPDQPSFRYALYHSDLRITSLPSEYHFIVNCPNYLNWKAKLLHGRGDLKKIAQEVNLDLGPRVYLPDLGFYPGFHGKRSLLRQFAKFARRAVTKVVWGN